MPGDYETFENVFLDMSKNSGKCRFAASGMGWKQAGGDTWTLQNTEISNAQWSRAAKGYEVKIFTRTMGIVQLDGFELDVGFPGPASFSSYSSRGGRSLFPLIPRLVELTLIFFGCRTSTESKMR